MPEHPVIELLGVRGDGYQQQKIEVPKLDGLLGLVSHTPKTELL